MDHQLNRPSQNTAGAVLGVLLILSGLLYLVARYFSVNLGGYGWPVFVIVPGLALLAFGVAVRPASGLVVPGAIVSVVGVILAFQNAFDAWATWSYAWALVVPGAVGLGIAIKGFVDGNQTLVERGGWTALFGLGLFAVFALFFEGVLRISGFDFGLAGNLALPLFLIAIGLALLFRSVIRPGKRSTQTPP